MSLREMTIVTLRKGKALPLIALVFLGGCGSEPAPLKGLLDSGRLSVSPGPKYDFGSVPIGQYRDATFTAENIGGVEVTQMAGSFLLSLNWAFAGGEFPGEGGTCSESLAPGKNCQVVVRFSPQYGGIIEGTLRISYFNGIKADLSDQPLLRGNGLGEVTP